MHPEAFAYVAITVARHGPFEEVVEFGSLDINGSVRPLFGNADFLGIDRVGGPGVDRIVDAAEYRTGRLHDCVVCCEVLEHTPDAKLIVEAAWQALRPGGRLIVTTACDPRAPHSAVDGRVIRDGEYYGNIDPDEFAGWLCLFEDVDIETHPDRGDLYATARKA